MTEPTTEISLKFVEVCNEHVLKTILFQNPFGYNNTSLFYRRRSWNNSGKNAFCKSSAVMTSVVVCDRDIDLKFSVKGLNICVPRTIFPYSSQDKTRQRPTHSLSKTPNTNKVDLLTKIITQTKHWFSFLNEICLDFKPYAPPNLSTDYIRKVRAKYSFSEKKIEYKDS